MRFAERRRTTGTSAPECTGSNSSPRAPPLSGGAREGHGGACLQRARARCGRQSTAKVDGALGVRVERRRAHLDAVMLRPPHDAVATRRIHGMRDIRRVVQGEFFGRGSLRVGDDASYWYAQRGRDRDCSCKSEDVEHRDPLRSTLAIDLEGKLIGVGDYHPLREPGGHTGGDSAGRHRLPHPSSSSRVGNYMIAHRPTEIARRRSSYGDRPTRTGVVIRRKSYGVVRRVRPKGIKTVQTTSGPDMR